MIRALSTAATGMQAQEQHLDQIAHDMANMNTTAYKRGRTEFQDLMYQTIKEPGGTPGQNQSPVGVQVGSGARVSAQYAVHEQGPTKMTNGMLDMLVNGDGFFTVQLPNGQVAYTRDGSFKLDGQGRIVTPGGYPLVPGLQIPPGTQHVGINNTGEVKITTAQNTEQVIGQIQLVTFINPGAMKLVGQNLMIPSSAAGQPVQSIPGENGSGNIQQGALEASNVKPTEAVMDMITTQRTYESNARIMTVGDQMWSTTNNIGQR
ncbi:MAG: flagellar basal-body rod protein FlgG [Deltaproteobacteria bacterium]|nr:flagellar basal-body rod protein FlgG [Deltaproteobacteria bacterium]